MCGSQVRKEYGKCLRTHCCSGKSVESSIGSGKSSASRPPGRYSTGSQVGSASPLTSFKCQCIWLSTSISDGDFYLILPADVDRRVNCSPFIVFTWSMLINMLLTIHL